MQALACVCVRVHASHLCVCMCLLTPPRCWRRWLRRHWSTMASPASTSASRPAVKDCLMYQSSIWRYVMGRGSWGTTIKAVGRMSQTCAVWLLVKILIRAMSQSLFLSHLRHFVMQSFRSLSKLGYVMGNHNLGICIIYTTYTSESMSCASRFFLRKIVWESSEPWISFDIIGDQSKGTLVVIVLCDQLVLGLLWMLVQSNDFTHSKPTVSVSYIMMKKGFLYNKSFSSTNTGFYSEAWLLCNCGLIRDRTWKRRGVYMRKWEKQLVEMLSR